MRKVIPIIIILAVLGGGGVALYRWQFAGTDNKRVPLTVHGNVEIREVNLSFRVPGRIREVLVDEGDPVEAGQLLARLDAEPLKRQLRAAEAQLSQAEANLQRLEAGFRSEEILQARARLQQSEASLRVREKDWHRQQALASTDAGTQQQLDRARAAYEEALAQVELARANLDLMEAGFRAEEIAAARAAVEKASAQVSTIQLQIEDTELFAPAGGVVLVRAAEPGSMIREGQTVLTESLTNRTWVRAYISETRLGDIHPGMPAQVYTDSTGDKAYTGQVGFISPRAEFTPKNVETEELRSDLVYRFRVVLKEADTHLRQGMPVTVKLSRPASEE